MGPFRLLAANLTWMAWNFSPYRALLKALKRPERAQERRLFTILGSNSASQYGSRFQFGRIETVRQYQDTVPVVEYDLLTPWIESIKGGTPNVLTVEPVLMMEKSAGSTSASKYIPYTRSQLREFRSGLMAWLHDVYRHRTALLATAAFWSVSPTAREREVTSGGIPVGFSSDAEYHDRVGQLVLGQQLAVPSEVSQITDMDASRYATLRFLIISADLGVVSVWNPSYLTILLRQMDDHALQLIDDVTSGRLTTPSQLPARVAETLRRRLRPQPRRGRELQRIFEQSGTLEPRQVWPKLKFISCWTSGFSDRFIPELRSLFPGAEIQGKGLLATEGVVSIPLSGHQGAVVAVNSHFYEFADLENPEDRPRLVEELELGRRYSVILTTGGGLYRYKLGDTVEVVGAVDRTPLVEFVGKAANVSDLCGEKLNEAWVGERLEAILGKFAVTPKFSMLAPEWGAPPYYVLFLEAPDISDEGFYRLIYSMEGTLRENYHYAYCRKLGQLGPLLGFRVRARGTEHYIRECEQLGQRPGTVKPSALHKEPGWCQRMDGELLKALGGDLPQLMNPSLA